MIKPIMKDPMFLSVKSQPATAADSQVAQDLIDTLLAHKNECVGMAANMIGVHKNIIVFANHGVPTIMYNPKIIEKSMPYEDEEGCLSLTGTRPVKRYDKIKVTYENLMFVPTVSEFSGYTAQIIQHEIDHCNGILV